MKKYYIILAISLFGAVFSGVMGVSLNDKDLESVFTVLLFVFMLPIFFSLYKIGSGMDSKPSSRKKKRSSRGDDDDDDDDDDNDSSSNDSDSGSDGGGDD